MSVCLVRMRCFHVSVGERRDPTASREEALKLSAASSCTLSVCSRNCRIYRLRRSRGCSVQFSESGQISARVPPICCRQSESQQSLLRICEFSVGRPSSRGRTPHVSDEKHVSSLSAVPRFSQTLPSSIDGAELLIENQGRFPVANQTAGFSRETQLSALFLSTSVSSFAVKRKPAGNQRGSDAFPACIALCAASAMELKGRPIFPCAAQSSSILFLHKHGSDILADTK